MPVTLIPSFLFYCLVSGITPGPANLLSLSTALKHGRDTALKQWRGLFCGYFIVALGAVFVTYFIGSAFENYIKVFSYMGAAYIIFLAVHILLDNGNSDNKRGLREGTFLNGFLVQVTNVKVIIFCVSALTSFVLPHTSSFWVLLLIGLFLPFTGPMTNLVWVFAGVSLQELFQKHRKVINVIMAVSLILCAVSIILI